MGATASSVGAGVGLVSLGASVGVTVGLGVGVGKTGSSVGGTVAVGVGVGSTGVSVGVGLAVAVGVGLGVGSGFSVSSAKAHTPMLRISTAARTKAISL